jgi:hypothetical protein
VGSSARCALFFARCGKVVSVLSKIMIASGAHIRFLIE